MQQAMDKQAIKNMVENLMQGVLEDILDTNVERRQVQQRHPYTRIILPCSVVGIAMDSKKQLLLLLEHNLFSLRAARTISLLEGIIVPFDDEVAVAAIANGGSSCESLQTEFEDSSNAKPAKQTFELQVLLHQVHELHQTQIGAELAQKME